MKQISLLLILIILSHALCAQYVYTIKADSVKIINDCDTAELIIENHTQNVLGFLYNKGKGRTEFRKVIKLNDSTLVFGDDTLQITGSNRPDSTTAGNGLSLIGKDVQLGQSTGAAGNPALLSSNREIPTAGYSVKLANDGKSLTLNSDYMFLAGVSGNNLIIQPTSITLQSPGSASNQIILTDGDLFSYSLHGNTDRFQITSALAITNEPTGRKVIISTDGSYTPSGNSLFQVHGTGLFTDTLRLNTVPNGTGNDSVLVQNSSNKAVYKVSQSAISSNIGRVTVSDANYTVASSDYLIAYVSLTTGRTVSLPAASTMANKTLIIKDESGSAGASNITIDGFGSEMIDGTTTKVISTNYGSLTIYSNGSDWFTIHQ